MSENGDMTPRERAQFVVRWLCESEFHSHAEMCIALERLLEYGFEGAVSKTRDRYELYTPLFYRPRF